MYVYYLNVSCFNFGYRCGCYCPHLHCLLHCLSSPAITTTCSPLLLRINRYMYICIYYNYAQLCVYSVRLLPQRNMRLYMLADSVVDVRASPL